MAIWVLIASIRVCSQQNRADITKISHKQRLSETVTPTVLAQQLTRSCSTDLQKVKAIFYWITQNISYKTRSTHIQKKTMPVLHTWNAVWVDSVWQLLDVTWASGYITWHGGEFVRQLDEQYFLTTPEQFIGEHYPDDMRWTLMHEPPLMPEFRHSPFKQKAFSKYQITTYNPAKEIIEASPGDTISIVLGCIFCAITISYCAINSI